MFREITRILISVKKIVKKTNMPTIITITKIVIIIKLKPRELAKYLKLLNLQSLSIYQRLVSQIPKKRY